MVSKVLFTIFLSAAITSSTLAQSALIDLRAPTRQISVDDVLSVSTIDVGFFREGLQISPDGKWIVFQLRRTLIAENKYVFDLWMVDTAGSLPPKQLTHNYPSFSDTSQLMPSWSPDSKAIAYIPVATDQIRLIHINDLKEETLIKKADLQQASQAVEAGVIRDLKWSPDGQSIAFLTNARTKEKEKATQVTSSKGIDADVDWYPDRAAPSFGLLLTVNIANRAVKSLTDTTLNVQAFGHAFDWSPDSRLIVFSASTDTARASYMRTDLYSVDCATRQIRELLKQDGWDENPVWSPDGKWIVFRSQKGKEDFNYTCWLALLPATGGQPVYAAEQFLRTSGGSPRQLFWSADGKNIFFSCFYKMSNQLFSVSLDTKQVLKITPTDDEWYSDFSYSTVKNSLAFTAQNVTEPTDIYVSSLPISNVKKLTDLNPQLSGIAHAQVEITSWRSADNKWEINGVLVKPADYQAQRKYPLLVLLQGGPQMVYMQYGLHQQFPVEVLAARGYLILAPNTRGRGGYGYAFEHAIADEKSYAINPLQDALTGVKELIKRGVADPERLGIMGHSYGGYLTAFAITQTKIFKAASVSEAHLADVPGAVFFAVGSPTGVNLVRDQMGVGSPYDPSQMELMVSQSPMHHMQNVRTPTLLEFGSEAGARITGTLLFQGLQAFKVPSEFIVYPKTGHMWTESLIRQESFNRILSWFDYWLLKKPYSNSQKQELYDRWRRLQEKGQATPSAIKP